MIRKQLLMVHVHLLHTPEPPHLAALRGALASHVVLTTGEDIAPQTEILIAGRPTREQLAPLKSLRTVLIPFAGIPDVTRDLMRDYPHLHLYNLHHNAPMTAEAAIALMYAAARTIIPADREFRKHDWTPRYESHRAPYRGVILEGKTVLILGYGEVGRRVGAVCRAAGMHVIATKRIPSDNPDVYTPDALPHLLPQANVLMVCLPATPQTDGLIGAKEIALLPSDAIIVNVGRAAVIDQAALYDALKLRQLHSAGLDVWYHYPPDEASRIETPPADYPFHELDNVVMSPHRAGGGGIDEVEFRRMAAIAASVNLYPDMPHRVDLDAGY